MTFGELASAELSGWSAWRPQAHPLQQDRTRSPTSSRGRSSCSEIESPRSTRSTASGATSRSRELGEIVSEVGRGLIDLGIEPGERVSMLCTTRIEWTWCSFAISAAGAVVVPIYPTNSPEECEWVAGNSESVAIVCEDAVAAREDRRRPRAAARRCEHRGDRGPGRGPRRRCRARASCAQRGRARDARSSTRAPSASRPTTRTRSSTRRGRPARRRAACSRHGNYRAVLDMVAERGVLDDPDDRDLPVPAARPLVRAAADAGQRRPRRGDRLLRRRPTKIIPELSEVHPTYLPSVPRIFEKLYTS